MTDWRGLPPRDSLDRLAQSSELLRNVSARLSLVQRPPPRMPELSPLPPRVDDRLNFRGVTRVKKSAMPPATLDRAASELYPFAAPRVDFLTGRPTRVDGRPDTVVIR